MPPRDELQGTFCLFPRAVPPTSWCLRVCFQTLHGYFFVPGCYPGDREMLTFSAFLQARSHWIWTSGSKANARCADYCHTLQVYWMPLSFNAFKGGRTLLVGTGATRYPSAQKKLPHFSKYRWSRFTQQPQLPRFYHQSLVKGATVHRGQHQSDEIVILAGQNEERGEKKSKESSQRKRKENKQQHKRQAVCACVSMCVCVSVLSLIHISEPTRPP